MEIVLKKLNGTKESLPSRGHAFEHAIGELVKCSCRKAVRESHAAVGQDSRVVRKRDRRPLHERPDRQ